MEATVGAVDLDETGVRWATVAVRALVGDVLHSTLSARVAVAGPRGGPSDPWLLPGDAWRP
jgi:hypothetical protein